MDHCNSFKYKSVPTQKCLNSGKNLIKVRFLFSSFIAADVKQSTTEFHTFLMKFSHLLHQRVWDNHLKLECIKTPSQNHNKNIYSLTPPVSEPMSQLQMWLSPKNTNTQGAHSANARGVTGAKKILWSIKSHNMVRTIHDHGSLKAINQFPQSTHLRTVIRSPHVFKKTREQFGMVKCIRSLDYYFQSNTCAQLFINCASVLKFPVEVQILLSSGK